MPSFSRRRRRNAYTLLEVLLSIAILLIVLVTLVEFLTGVDRAWRSSAADPYADAQEAFESVAAHLASATLAPYTDFADSTGAFRTGTGFVPDHVARRSDLAFVCFPAASAGTWLPGRTVCGSGVFYLEPGGLTQTDAHAGLERLLNAMGYFVEFGDDSSAPGFLPPLAHVWRWRLKEVVQPAESLQVFASTTSAGWIQQLVPAGAPLTVLADNVIALVVLPDRSATDSGPALAPGFAYDSRDASNRLTLHQLPPRLQVVLVAIDPTAATHLAALDGTAPPPLVAPTLFQQAAQLPGDLATLDGSLTAQKIGHRIFQREILLSAANWSNTPSP